MKYLKRFDDVNEGLFDFFKSKPKKELVEFKNGETYNKDGVHFIMTKDIKIEKDLFDMTVQKVVSLSKSWVLSNRNGNFPNECIFKVGRNTGSRTEYNSGKFPLVIMISFALSDGDEGQIPVDIREDMISNVKNTFKGHVVEIEYNHLRKNPILFEVSLCKAPKGFNEAVSPSELMTSGELYTKITSYARWEDVIYPVGLENIETIEQKDAEFITHLVRLLCNAMGHRYVATIDVCKRYYQDDVDSAIAFNFKGEKGWSTDDHMIFYKFKDEWWAVEAKILGSYNYYICDNYEGIKKLMTDLTDKWRPNSKTNESSSNQPYRKITENDYSQKVWGDTDEGTDEETEWIEDHWDKFDSQEITKIANILYTGRWIANLNQDFRPSNKKDIDHLVEDDYLGDDPAEGCSLRFFSPNYKPNENWIYSHLVITKLKDEWFYLYYKPPGQRYHQTDVMYLECDQWSGLIDCLNWIAFAQIL